MAGVMKAAIRDILTRLRTIEFRGGGAFSFVAVWNDQLSRMAEGTGYSLPMPAAFVEIIQNPWQLLGMGVSIADIIVRFHIAHQQYDAGDGTLDQDLDVYDLRDAVLEAFVGYQAAKCSSLGRIGEQPDYAHNNIYHYTIDFTCCIVDTAGSPLDPDANVYITREPPIGFCIHVNDPADAERIFADTFNDLFA